MFVIRRTSVVAACVVALAVAQAPAAIDLELRAVPEECSATVLEVDLYAVSDDETDQGLSAMDVVLSWNPTALRLLGINKAIAYPYAWQRSTFPQPDPFGLNDTWSDGDALYQAFSQLAPAPPAYATPAGLLVVRLRFEKLIVSEPTSIAIEASLHGGVTVVYDATVPGLAVTGSLNGVTVTPLKPGDADCSKTITFLDINYFVAALSGEQVWIDYHIAKTGQPPTCSYLNCDTNCDGDVDFADINSFANLMGL